MTGGRPRRAGEGTLTEPPPATLTARSDAPIRLTPADDAPRRDPDKTPDLPPEILARYESITLLGRGGMGVVYRARDRRLERDVALKLLFDDGEGEGEDRGRSLLREARSQARLDHPHACKVYEVGVAGGQPYLVMQLIDGATFEAAKARMTLEEKVTVVRQVALALHEAHRFGLVHRDVKPSNIMVERADDGAWRPYLMDFGIAREIGGAGLTLTGAIAGTPAFMAPEQARGEVRALDRRTDVYSLGATLYDVLAGRPPFQAPNAWQIMRQITSEEAPPIRAVRPEVPLDLEAILARCLEKEPHRRYDSAKALGEDLQRFLDGDPVQARRLSWAYVLLRKARRHKLAVALSGAAILAVLLVAALGLRARRLATEQASLARELGENVKEMELFLRTAYALPLHDVEREKDLVRARLQVIEARTIAAGRAGEGPGHYALGRGHLSLNEPEEARAHLEKASLAGYASPELDYALGLALGELGEKAREAAKRIGNPDEKKAREAAIVAEYEEPARRHLRASLGARLETAAYAEGLLLLHENKPEEALVKAREAFAKMPWLHEAKKLEGDAHFAIGSRFRHDAAFDYDRMSVDFQAAAESYERAAEIARSDPRVHVAECELWNQTMNAASVRAASLKPSFEKAKAACGRAITASSKDDGARVKLAFVYVTFAWSLTTATLPEDPASTLEEAISLAKEAMRRSPREPMAPYVLGEAWRTEARYLNDRGLECKASLDQAIPAYEEAIRLEPTFVWAIQALSSGFWLRASREMLQGIDPSPSLERALALCRRAGELDPSSLVAPTWAVITHLRMAEHLVEVGRDPAGPLSLAREGIETLKTMSHERRSGDFLLAYSHWIMATYLLAAGKDPSPSLDLGAQLAAALGKDPSSSQDSSEMFGNLGVVRALHRLGRGEDPSSAARDAEEAFERTAKGNPWDLTYPIGRARAEIIALRWALKEHKIKQEAFASARARLAPLLSPPRVNPRLHLALAEIHQIEAAWLLEGSKSAEQPLSEGLAMVEQALALNSRMARALLVKGSLLLMRSSAARGPEGRTQAVLEARQALSAASKENPLLERDIAPLLLELKKIEAR